jgi:hypothetical protein
MEVAMFRVRYLSSKPCTVLFSESRSNVDANESAPGRDRIIFIER